jgi:hypothetical protein
VSIHRFTDARREPRVPVDAKYSDVRARPKGERRYRWTGHVYDISRAGMRFEFDDAIEPGTAIEVRLRLPGGRQEPIRVSGRVVRILEEDDEPGPVRMAMSFAAFRTAADEDRLEAYLGARGLRRAA